MAEITGGGLHFISEINNDAVNKAIEQTLDRIKGLSGSVESLGKDIEKAFIDMARDAKEQGLEVEKVFDGMQTQIDNTFQVLDSVFDRHKATLEELEAEYVSVSKAAGEAFQSGNDDEYRQLDKKMQALEGEIAVRKKLMSETAAQADELGKVDKALNDYIQKTNKSKTESRSFETQIQRVRSEMQQLAFQGVDPLDERYQKLQDQLRRMIAVQKDVEMQGRNLAHDQAGLQGVISGLSGLAGGFSAVTGAVSLFAGENEDLQKVMTRLQSVMATTMGLQQLSVALDKDSAFQLNTVGRVRQWWNNIVAQSATVQTADTAATVANTSAKKAGALANTALARSFRIVGAAIKSIPGIGWLLAGLTGLVALYKGVTNEAAKAARRQEEFNKALAECVTEPISSINRLRATYNTLGSDMQKKQKFISDNKKEFEDLGITINSVNDAEGMLTNPATVQKFVAAQITKAKATIQMNQIMQKQQELQKAQADYDSMDKNTVLGARKYVEIQGLNADMQFQLELFAQMEEEYKALVDEINKAADEALKGSIAGLKKQIQDKTDFMETLTNPTKIKKAQAEIRVLQKQLDNMQQGKSKSTTKDPFEESLEKAKKNYESYIKFLSSSDEKVRNSAAKTFEKQLSQGATYLEFLVNNRDELLKKNPSVNVVKQLQAVNAQIAEQTQAANDEEKKRQDDHLQQLVEQYYLYYDSRKRIQQEFDNDMLVLQKQAEKAQTESQKKFVQTMIDNRKRDYERDMAESGSGDAEYEALLRAHESYERQRDRISEEFARKRELARKKGDTALVAEIDKDEEKALQEILFDKIVNSDAFAQLFSNLDRLTTSEMINLRNTIEGEWDNLNLSPEQWKALRERIDEVTDEIEKRNPFTALLDAIKRYKKGEKDVDFKDVARAAGSSIDLVKGTFDAVIDGFTELGITGDEVTRQLMGSLSGLMGSASELAQGIANSNPLGIIQGSIGVLSNVFNVFNFRDRRAERQIQKHAENVRNLERAYNSLEKAIDSALGSGRYLTTQNAIKNLEQQQKELARQAELERGKKKSDKGKVREYEEAIISAKNRQKELIDQLREDILGLDARSAAEQLGGAFIDAFKAGEDAVAAFGKKADDIIADIMRRMILQKVLEEPLGRILNNYTKRWYNDKGDFIGFGSIMRDANQMGTEIKGLGEDFAAAMASLPDDIKKYFTGENTLDSESSLSGAIKGVSEETATKLGGQMNAMRINQLEATAILRNQLFHLANIDRNAETIKNNTKYNKFLEGIYNKISQDTLRAKGLGGF